MKKIWKKKKICFSLHPNELNNCPVKTDKLLSVLRTEQTHFPQKIHYSANKVNVCRVNLYFGAGIMNNETLRKAQQNYTYELIAFDPGNAGYGVSEGPIFKFFSGGTCPWTPYLIRAFGANSSLVSFITLCLMFSYKKNPWQDNTNDDSKSEWGRSLNTKEYKTRLP